MEDVGRTFFLRRITSTITSRNTFQSIRNTLYVIYLLQTYCTWVLFSVQIFTILIKEQTFFLIIFFNIHFCIVLQLCVFVWVYVRLCVYMQGFHCVYFFLYVFDGSSNNLRIDLICHDRIILWHALIIMRKNKKKKFLK